MAVADFDGDGLDDLAVRSSNDVLPARSNTSSSNSASGIGDCVSLTVAMAEMDLDIHSAKVQTLGPEVIDTFYVRSAAGEKITDPDDLAEIERAIMGALGDEV